MPRSKCLRGLLTSAAAVSNWPRALRNSPSISTGKTCLDIGSSTGGFTDALLQAGAARVHAVDVGAGQLDWNLRTDPRVRLHEGINARELRPSDIGEPVDLLTYATSASFPSR